MDELEIAETIERYNRRLEEFGATEKALGWGAKGRSRLRFEILLSMWQFSGASVLDVGCGFGDLFQYMNERGFSGFSYTGVDINPKLIEIAHQRHKNASFEVANVFTDNYRPEFDFVLASGTFNYKLKDSFAFVQQAFTKFAQIAKKGFAVNFLSSKVDYTLDHAYHANPCQILELAYSFSNNIILRNDYMPFEFTVFVNLGTVIDPKLTVYEDFSKYGS